MNLIADPGSRSLERLQGIINLSDNPDRDDLSLLPDLNEGLLRCARNDPASKVDSVSE